MARKLLPVLMIAMMCGMVACRRSPYVHATLVNVTGDTLQQVEVNYPSASFGKDRIAAGAQFEYRFKIQGSGKPHIDFLDSRGKEHSADGPQLNEGEAGTLEIRITPGYSVAWARTLNKNQ